MRWRRSRWLAASIAVAVALSTGRVQDPPEAAAEAQLAPNGGRFIAGTNAAVWRETNGAMSPAASVAQAAASAAPGFDVVAVWAMTGGEWKYFLPPLAESSTLREVGPLASLFVMLQPASSLRSGEDLAASIVERINSVRRERALPPLRSTPELTAATENYARFLNNAGYPNIIGDRHALDGTPGDRVTREGYVWNAVGEVLAYHYVATAEAFVELWMASPPHRAILLGDFADIGVGCYQTTAGAFLRVICVGNMATP